MMNQVPEQSPNPENNNNIEQQPALAPTSIPNKKESHHHPVLNVLFGACIGGLVMTLVCCILFMVLYKQQVTKLSQTYANMSSLTLGKDVVSKMNALQSAIDQYFLFDYDKEAMADAIYDAMLDSLDDPYSTYYTPQEYQDLITSTTGTYSGLGVVVTKNVDTGEIMVVMPYENSPGEEAGLLPDDVIVAADGTVLTGMDLDQAVTYIKGEEGTVVTLTVKRGNETFDVQATRRKIDIITVDSEMLDDKIGYIVVSQFDYVTIAQFKKAVDDLNEQGMVGLIVDIRSNPGGRLDAVVAMLDYILPEGLLVYTEDKAGNREEFSSDEACNLKVPCAVLVNGNSASASEIFAGAMQDHEAATIIGTQTFGKGIVQTVMSLTDGSALKITVENYFTPNGHNIHGIGITPDQVVEFDTEAYKADETDTQLNAAIENIKSQIN